MWHLWFPPKLWPVPPNPREFPRKRQSVPPYDGAIPLIGGEVVAYRATQGRSDGAAACYFGVRPLFEAGIFPVTRINIPRFSTAKKYQS